VLLMTGKRKCTDLGGLFRTMPFTCVCGIVGALAISSFPLTSGFVSKSMIAQGAADEHLQLVWMALAAASAGVFLHAGIKLPWFVFFQKDSGLRPAEPPANMRAAMLLLSAACIGIGLAPGWLYSLLPYSVAYVPYTGSHVVFQLQLLLFSGLAFFLMLDLLKRTLTITLDADWVWRRLGRSVLCALDEALSQAWSRSAQRLGGAADRATQVLAAALGPQGTFGRTWPTGTMALWITIMLGAYLFLAYL
jgi:multicomponent Na+:H+ antiporter subunit D